MTEATIRAAIVDGIEDVTDAGVVYDHIPWSGSWDVHLALFQCRVAGINAFRGFTVSLAAGAPISVTGEILGTTAGTDVKTFNYTVRGYHGINEADNSENEFIEVVIAVMDKIDTLNLSEFKRDRAQLVTYQPETIGDVLCHYAEIAVSNIREEVDC